MGRISIGIGVRFITHEDVVYDISEQLLGEDGGDKFRVQNRTFGGERIMTRMDIVKLADEGKIRFHAEGKNTVEVSGSGVKGYHKPDFSALPEHQKEEAKERFNAIEPLLAIENPTKKDVIKRAEELEKYGKKGHYTSLYRWSKAYRQTESIFSLVSSYENCGSIEKQFPDEVEEIIKAVLDEKYLKRERESVRGLWLLVKGKVNQKNKQRMEKNQEPLPIPSESTIRRRVKDIGIFKTTKEKYGTHAAFNKYGNVDLKEKPDYPLQRVEVDHTRLDLFVVDEEKNLPLGRPWLTCLIDCATGYPLGFYIGFEHPSYTSVMYALKHAMSVKSYVKERYPDIDNEWLAYGVPEVLVVDNGKEFKSKALEDVCLQMGMKLVHAPPRNPWYKGQIERFFRTHNDQLLHSKPGTSFSNIGDRGDYDPKKNAVIDLTLLLKIFHKWLLDSYVIDAHRGVKGKPQELWREGTRGLVQPDVATFKPDWEIILGKKEKGSIQRTGIRYKYLFYRSPEFNKLQMNLVKKYGKTPVDFKVNPDDVSKIHVYDEFNDKYIEAYCTRMEYAKGLRLITHQAILDEARKKFNDVDDDKLAETKVMIEEWIEKEWDSNKTSDRTRAARHKGMGSQHLTDEETKEEEKQEELPSPKESKPKTPKTNEKGKGKGKKVVKTSSPLFADEDDDFSSDLLTS